MDDDAIRAYYAQPQVRARLAEFCGAPDGDPAAVTCRYLLDYLPAADAAGARWPTGAFAALLARGADLGRSLWDAAGLVADLDLDYQNVDYPAEGLLHPRETFDKLEPVYRAVVALGAELDLAPLAVLSPKGYHFLWHIPASSPAYSALVALGEVGPSLAERYCRPAPDLPDAVPLERGRAFAGLGRVLEYLVHQVLLRARDAAPLPLVTTGLRVGADTVGREAISLDLSAFGDPLHLRGVRCAYSVCRKHHLAPGFAGTVAASVSPLVYVPRPAGDRALSEALAARADLRQAAALAAQAPARLPDGGRGTLALTRRYRRSALGRFHQEFDAGWHDRPESWPAGYDRLELERLPACVAEPLRRPNDWLLKPTNIQTVVRVLWSLGWHPRAIAGLVRSKYERDHGWGDRWQVADPATRADFYVRLSAGLIATGVDSLDDFNCVSQLEKGYCPRAFCGHNLLDYRPGLWARRTP